MRFKFALTAVMVLAPAAVMAQDLSTEKGQLSYAVGWDLGADIGRRGEDFDVEALIDAIRDSVAGNEPQVAPAEMRRLLTELQEKVRQEQIAALQALAQENQAKAETFLAENQGKTNVVVLPSGVQYRIIEEGTGGRPGLEDRVSVHYRSSKIDGIEIDSSFARGVPQEFTVNEVLQGWQEVLPLMKVGSTWQIWVPPELAFGQRGNPPAVGPNEALQFDLKLIEVIE
jgi:FKBP-type peptidyl-prolyl cis-trans isomerase FklB